MGKSDQQWVGNVCEFWWAMTIHSLSHIIVCPYRFANRRKPFRYLCKRNPALMFKHVWKLLFQLTEAFQLFALVCSFVFKCHCAPIEFQMFLVVCSCVFQWHCTPTSRVVHGKNLWRQSRAVHEKNVWRTSQVVPGKNVWRPSRVLLMSNMWRRPWKLWDVACLPWGSLAISSWDLAAAAHSNS